MSLVETGVTARSVQSGWVAHHRFEDGTSVSFWGVTEQEARSKAGDVDG